MAAALFCVLARERRQAIREFAKRLESPGPWLIQGNAQRVPGAAPGELTLLVTNSLVVNQLKALAKENTSLIRLRQISDDEGFATSLSIAVFSAAPTGTNLLFSIVGESLLFIDPHHYCEASGNLHSTFLKTATKSR